MKKLASRSCGALSRPQARMNARASSMRPANWLYFSVRAELAMKSRFHWWTWCTSAKPPWAKARSRLRLAVDW
ncbi:hypothetical protein D3C84_1245850 [compost metagenome]